MTQSVGKKIILVCHTIIYSTVILIIIKAAGNLACNIKDVYMIINCLIKNPQNLSENKHS